MSWLQHDLPHYSIPPLPKVNLAGTRLQTGHDRSLRRGLNHAVPAAKLPVVRCFRGGVTLRERSLSSLTPPRLVPRLIHRQHFAKTAPIEASASLCTLSRTTNTPSKAICESKLFQNKCTDDVFACLCCYTACVGRRAKTISAQGRKPEISQIYLSSGIY